MTAPLALDARQRAMLQEMGITVWPPRRQPGAPTEAQAPPAAAARAAQPPRAHPPAERTPRSLPAAPAPPARADAAPPAPATAPGPAAAAKPAPAAAPQAKAMRLQAPAGPLYQPSAPQPGPRWLVLAEGVTAPHPLKTPPGRLLDAMLRALRLQHLPQVYLASLTRPLFRTPPPDEHDRALLQQVLADTQPHLVLALGLPVARLLLGGKAPLGQLRVRPQRLPNGVPVVVSYDLSFLMRAPTAKAAAWVDLCHAQTQALQSAQRRA